MHLVCFPYKPTTSHAGTYDILDCLVLPEIPLFQKVNVQQGSCQVETAFVNKYLLLLLVQWTNHSAGLYKDRNREPRQLMPLPGATKKSAVKAYIETVLEQQMRLRREAQEGEAKAREDLNQLQEQLTRTQEQLKRTQKQLHDQQVKV